MTQTQTLPVKSRSDKTAAIQEEIIRIGQSSYERLPLFEAIIDRAVQSLGPALRNALNVQAEVVLQGVDYMASGDALAQAPDPGMITLVHATPWDGTLAVTLDPALLFAALEIMLGASDGTTGDADADKAQKMPPPAWQPRAFTSIEKRLGAQLVGWTLREVTAAFAPLTRVSFSAGKIESGPRDVLFTPGNAGCARVTIRITLDGCGGDLCLIVPHRTLDAVRPLLAQPRGAEQLGSDPTWSSLLAESLQDTPVTLTAVLHEQLLPLSGMLDWAPGQTLQLGIDPDHQVTVTCGKRQMFRAALGRRKNGSVALRVTTAFEENPKEAEDGVTD